MLYIFAGSAQQASDWLQSCGYTGRAQYIHGPDSLRGQQRGLHYVKVGTWYERNDVRDIERALAERQAVRVPANTGSAPQTSGNR